MAYRKRADSGISRTCVRVRKLRKLLNGLAFLPLVALSATSAMAGSAHGQGTYSAFVRQIQEARAADYIGQRGVYVQNAVAFYEMRSYLENYYAGMTASRSFLAGEQMVDCVPLAQHPALRHSRALAAPPPDDYVDDGDSPGITESAPNARGEGHGARGNVERCASGTIPLRRITLDEMTKFRTLKEFLHKAPDSATHEYAVATE